MNDRHSRSHLQVFHPSYSQERIRSRPSAPIMERISIILVILFVTGCAEQGEPLPAPEHLYQTLLTRSDQASPGSGIDIFNDTVKDRPMAYALILSAEVQRVFHSNERSP